MNEEKSGNLRDMVENYTSLGRKGLRYWKRGGLVGLVVLALGLAFVAKKPRIYKSEASAAIQDVSQNSGAEALPPDVAQAELKARLEQVYGSRSNLGRVIDELHLYPWLTGKTSRLKVIESFQDAVTFTAAGRDAFHLEFVYQDPAIAQHAVQRLLQLYTDERRNAGQMQGRNDLASVNTALAGLETVLSDQEDRLERFEHANHDMVEQVRLRRLGQLQARMGMALGLGAPQGVAGTTQPVASIGEPGDSTGTRRLRIRLAGLQGRLNALQRQAEAPATPAPVVHAAPVEDSERVQTLRHNLADLRERLARLRTTYTDQYPDVQITMRRVADAERELNAAVASERGHGASTAAVAVAARNPEQLRAEMDSIRVEIDRTRSALYDAARADRENAHASPAVATHGGGPAVAVQNVAATSPSAATQEPAAAMAQPVPVATAPRNDEFDRPYNSLVEVESAWDRLTTELTTSRTRYQTLLTRKFELQATLDTVTTQGADVLRIIDPPTLPAEPEPPGRTRMAMMVFALAVALALGVAGLSGYLDSRLYEPADLRRWGELPELPVIPDLHAVGTPSVAPAATSRRG